MGLLAEGWAPDGAEPHPTRVNAYAERQDCGRSMHALIPIGLVIAKGNLEADTWILQVLHSLSYGQGPTAGIRFSIILR